VDELGRTGRRIGGRRRDRESASAADACRTLLHAADRPQSSRFDGGWVRWRFKDWAPSQELMVVAVHGRPTAGRDESAAEQAPFFESWIRPGPGPLRGAERPLGDDGAAAPRRYRAAPRSIDGAAQAAVSRFYRRKGASPPSPKARRPLDLKVNGAPRPDAKQLESKPAAER